MRIKRSVRTVKRAVPEESVTTDLGLGAGSYGRREGRNWAAELGAMRRRKERRRMRGLMLGIGGGPA
jgi:hypothetical protein